MNVRCLLLAMIAWGMAAQASPAAEGRGVRFWNLTSSTVASLRLSPAGKNEWGADQCPNDPDGGVDHDERLRLEGITPGRYDLKLGDKSGRTCLVRNVAIEANKVFSVTDKDLTDCSK